MRRELPAEEGCRMDRYGRATDAPVGHRAEVADDDHALKTPQRSPSRSAVLTNDRDVQSTPAACRKETRNEGLNPLTAPQP